jgi:hypothetical protein
MNGRPGILAGKNGPESQWQSRDRPEGSPHFSGRSGVSMRPRESVAAHTAASETGATRTSVMFGLIVTPRRGMRPMGRAATRMWFHFGTRCLPYPGLNWPEAPDSGRIGTI